MKLRLIVQGLALSLLVLAGCGPKPTPEPPPPAPTATPPAAELHAPVSVVGHVRLDQIDGISVPDQGVIVGGVVINELPWAITNIKVIVLFDEDMAADPLVATTTERVEAGATGNFSALKKSTLDLQTFRTGLQEYTIQTNNVIALLAEYRNTPDPVYQLSTLRTLHTLDSSSVLDLLASIDVANRYFPPTLHDIILDLGVLDALNQLHVPQAAEPLMKLLAWYEAMGVETLDIIRLDLLEDGYSLAYEIPLVSESTGGMRPLTMDYMVHKVMVAGGPAAVPSLIAYSLGDDPLYSYQAKWALDEMNEKDVHQWLDESDPDTLQAILDVLDGYNQPGFAEALLKAADAHPELIETIKPMAGQLAAAQPAAFVGALQSADPAVAALASDTLLTLGDAAVPALEAALAEYGIESPATRTPEALLAALNEYHQAERERVVAAKLGEIDELVAAGKCSDAIAQIEALALTLKLSDYAASASSAYWCAAEQQAQAEHYAEALSLSDQALSFDPANPSAIHQQRFDWHLQQARQEIQASQRKNAAEALAKAQAEGTDDPAPARLMNRVSVSVNLPTLVIGLLGMLIFVGVASFKVKGV